MTWDPEIDDPTSRPATGHDPYADEEPPVAIRTVRPDVFVPIDPDASTQNSTRLPSRPSRTPNLTSEARTARPGPERPRAT